jgi:integrase
MVGRRKVASRLPPRLYEEKGKRVTSYYTITVANKYVGLGRDLVAAKKKLAELEGETVAAGTIADLIADTIKARRKLVAAGKLSKRTVDDNENEHAPNLIDAFGKMPVDSVKPKHIWLYLHKTRGVEAPVRANKEISFLQVCLGAACGQGLIDVNPCVGVKRNEETGRTRAVSDKELRAFCKMAYRTSEAGKRVALAACIAYLTGKAQGQILALTRANVRPEGISFGKRKGGAAVDVAWSPRLRRYVAASSAMASNVSSIYVVHTRDGGAYTSQGFKHLWGDLMTAYVAAGGERFTFHDLRAKAVTDVIEQGRKASELTGHRNEQTIARHYDRRAVRKSAPVR